jgi:hypothetical protein
MRHAHFDESMRPAASGAINAMFRRSTMRAYIRIVAVVTVLVAAVGLVPNRHVAADDIGRTTCDGTGTAPSWRYSLLGRVIGLADIRLAENAGRREIYVDAGEGAYWVALAYDPTRQNYEQVFVSPFVPTSYSPYYVDPIVKGIGVGEVAGDAADEIVVLISNGQVQLYDQGTKARVGGFQSGAAQAETLAVADVDGDGGAEILVCTAAHLYVYSGDGALEWELDGVGGTDLEIAQMDGDAALEIAATNGKVVDGTSRLVQFAWPHGFGRGVGSADVDGDGRAELLAADIFAVYCYDVDRQLPKWSYGTVHHGDVHVVDMDGDGSPEMLLGDGSNDEIRIVDAVTLAPEGAIPVLDSGVTNVATGDTDGDGDLDVVYGAGHGSSGPDHLYVADGPSRQIAWQSVDLVGPFAPPAVGDLDGDGRLELVTASYQSDSGYDDSWLLVFDASTGRLRATVPGLAGSDVYFGVVDVKLRDVDGDGRAEILVAYDISLDGAVEIFDFDASNTLTRIWTNATFPPGGPFGTAEAADVDGDGQLEIVAAMSGRTSADEGVVLFVYDYATRAEEWHSADVGYASQAGLEIADVDADGALEMIVVNEYDKLYIYDGPTKTLEAAIPIVGTGLAVDRSTTPPTIVVGTQTGALARFQHASGQSVPYVEVSRTPVSTVRIDGVTVDATGRTWVGSGGRLREVDATGACVWASESYGAGFGRRVAPLDGTEGFFTAGPYAVVGFGTPAAGASATVGVYHAGSGTYFLRNANAPGPADVAFGFGPVGLGWRALAGNWDGVGGASVGLYDASTGFFFLRQANASGGADAVFGYGPGGAGWEPVVGDWDGDGDETVGLYDAATGFFYLRNENASGGADQVYGFGPGGAGWRPVAGDWDGDGVETVGLYDAAAGYFYLRNEHGGGGADVVFGFGPAGAGWEPVVGDWDGDGVETVGLYAGATGSYFLRNANAPGGADVVFSYGPAGAVPLAADWDGF